MSQFNVLHNNNSINIWAFAWLIASCMYKSDILKHPFSCYRKLVEYWMKQPLLASLFVLLRVFSKYNFNNKMSLHLDMHTPLYEHRVPILLA